MRRIFSTFPGGGPGLGLLVLRAAIGFTLVSQGIHCLSDSHTPSLAMWAVALLMVASGTLALIGYMTPLAAIVGGLLTVATWMPWFPAPTPSLFLTRLATFLAAAIAIAIVCLGPGAFSLDARLFGRREIVIPKRSS
ncbi:MAG: hypothetical protein WBV69_12525 [Candidatus Sulfotelmatobacter sp.]